MSWAEIRYRVTVVRVGFGYWLRGLLLDPAPADRRCCMGGPVHPWVHCPRYAVGNGLWCRKHEGGEDQ